MTIQPCSAKGVGALSPATPRNPVDWGVIRISWPSLPCMRQMRRRFCCTEINICKVLGTTL